MTVEHLQELRINAINKAGEELADLTPEELAEMDVQERTDLLKYNIGRHMKDLLGRDFVEIRLLDRPTGKLLPLLTVGMTSQAAPLASFTPASRGMASPGMSRRPARAISAPIPSTIPTTSKARRAPGVR